MKSVLSVACLILTIIFFFIFFLRLFSWGQSIIFHIRLFFKRWSLKILTIILDILYIPILNCLYSLLIAKKFEIGVGSYVQIYPTNEWNNFMIHYASNILPCTDGSSCLSCAEQFSWRLNDDISLRYHQDVINTSIISIIYVVFFILIGIPVVWYKLIKKNIALIENINVFGHTVADKWGNLIFKLASSGVNIFSHFKMNRVNFAVIMYVMKFILSFISVMGYHFAGGITYFLPFYYIVLLLIHIFYRPYINFGNTVIEILFNGFNLLLSILPILEQGGIYVSSTAVSIVLILAFVLPVLSVIVFIIYDCRKSSGVENEDPTAAPKLTSEETAKREEELQTLIDDDDKKLSKYHHEVHQIEKTHVNEEKKKIFDELLKKYDFDDDMAECKVCDLWSIADLQKKLEDPKYDLEKNMTINQVKMSESFADCYEAVDTVLDGATIEFFSNCMQLLIVIGAAAFGWYYSAGSLMLGQSEEFSC